MLYCVGVDAAGMYVMLYVTYWQDPGPSLAPLDFDLSTNTNSPRSFGIRKEEALVADIDLDSKQAKYLGEGKMAEDINYFSNDE